MSSDSKAKIEYLRMRIMKLKQSRESGDNDVDAATLAAKRSEETLESRIEELRHRLRIESACLEGAKNVLKLLQSTKNPEKKALQEVRTLRRQLTLTQGVNFKNHLRSTSSSYSLFYCFCAPF